MKPVRLASATLAISMIGCAGAVSEAPEGAARSIGKKMVQGMTEAKDALVAAHDALVQQHPSRKMGNILVEPTPEVYHVLFVDLPKPDVATDVGAVRVTVDRGSGKVSEVKDVVVAKTPYGTDSVSSTTISGRQAFDTALAALKGFETFDKEGKLTVELVGKVYKVTFPLPPSSKSPLGSDYAFQVWIDVATAKVVNLLVAN